MKKLIYLVFPFIITLLWVFLSGCGGSTTGGGGGGGGLDKIKLIDQVEDPLKPSAISGSVVSLTNNVLDYPSGAYIELISQTDPTLKYVTRSSTRGGYQINDVTPGKYDIFAYVPDKINPVLTGELKNITLLGNIPSSINNILTGRAEDIGVIQGQVKQNGLPVPGASVTLDISAYGIAHLEDPSNLDQIVFLAVIYADDAGQYRFEFPVGAQKIFVAAHSTTSMSTEKSITGFDANTVINQDIDLTVAEPAVSPLVEYDIFSTTLEKATVENAQAAAAITRATANKTRSTRMAKIADRMSTRLNRSNIISSFIENDVYWTVQNSDVGTLGFDVYRGDALIGDYFKVGNCDDPFMTFYFDSDPALTTKPISFYRVRSYAANNILSPISSTVVSASPLPQFTSFLPADNTSVKRDTLNGNKVRWSRVAGAKSYLFVLYSNAPNNNSIPPLFTIIPDDSLISTNDYQEYDISGNPVGEYWWVIAAYNNAVSSQATAGTFSTYRKITLTL